MSEHFEATIGRDKIWLNPSCGSLIELKDGRLMLACPGHSRTKETGHGQLLRGWGTNLD